MSVEEVMVGKSINELLAIQEAAKAEIENAKARELQEFEVLVDLVKEKANQLGLNVKNYFVEKKALKPKYQNPERPEETYTGIGKRPAWVNAILDGVPKDQYQEALKPYLIA